MNDEQILRAAQIAKRWHDGQVRKYHQQPYIVHPARVASRVMLIDRVTTDEIVAAWLHDVVEDTPCTFEDLLSEGFTEHSVSIVNELTNPSKEHSHLPRIERKEIDHGHIKDISHEAKRIKLIDRADNLKDMGLADDRFKSLYVAESLQLANLLANVDEELLEELYTSIEFLGFPRNHCDERTILTAPPRPQ